MFTATFQVCVCLCSIKLLYYWVYFTYSEMGVLHCTVCVQYRYVGKYSIVDGYWLIASDMY